MGLWNPEWGKASEVSSVQKRSVLKGVLSPAPTVWGKQLRKDLFRLSVSEVLAVVHGSIALAER